MTIDRAIAIEATFKMTEGAEMVAVGIPQHILDHPELDPETREILTAVSVVMPLLCSVVRLSFENALQAEDAIDRVKEELAKLEEK